MFRIGIFVYICINLAYGSDNVCVGKHRLPINDKNYEILKRKIGTLHNVGLGRYPEYAIFENNGKTVTVKYFYDKTIEALTRDGPYEPNDIYHLALIYFNWLKPEESGTEENALPIELHVVFFNKKYKTYENALKQNFGLTVWSFRYVQDEYLKADVAEDFYEALENIQKPNTSSKQYHPQIFLPPIFSLVDTDQYYYVYQGRLVPLLHPCSADVIWIEVENRVKINSEKVEILRKLLASDGQPLMNKVHDYPPPNGPIYRNADHYITDEVVLPFEYFNATYFYEDSNEAVGGSDKFSLLLLLSLGIITRWM